MILCLLISTPPFVIYCLYQIVYKKNVKALIVLLTTVIHSLVIAEPNKYVAKFLRKLETLKWFDKF